MLLFMLQVFLSWASSKFWSPNFVFNRSAYTDFYRRRPARVDLEGVRCSFLCFHRSPQSTQRVDCNPFLPLVTMLAPSRYCWFFCSRASISARYAPRILLGFHLPFGWPPCPRGSGEARHPQRCSHQMRSLHVCAASICLRNLVCALGSRPRHPASAGGLNDGPVV